MPSRTVSAGAQVAPAAAADAGNRCGECHGGLGLRPGGLALRSGRRPLLSATAAAATLGAIGRSSPSSAEPGGVAGRRGGPLQEQQHRGLEAESEAAPGGLRARQARVRYATSRNGYVSDEEDSRDEEVCAMVSMLSEEGSKDSSGYDLEERIGDEL